MILVFIFVIGYLLITVEHSIRISKSAVALLTGGLCWALLFAQHDSFPGIHLDHELESHLSEIAGILFFLLGAMTIVELMDAHNAFAIITGRLRTRSKRKLIWIIGVFTFFLSAILDNLTTSIVMASLLRKLVSDREDRLVLCGIVVVAANAGGAWSPIGDVTTTMLWAGKQISAMNIIMKLIIPSLVCVILPMLWFHFRFRGEVHRAEGGDETLDQAVASGDRNTIFFGGLIALIGVPVLKQQLHIPPYLGVMIGLGMMWILTEIIHRHKDENTKGSLTVSSALQRIDTPSILFFLGILLAVSSLQTSGLLTQCAHWIDSTLKNTSAVALSIGGLSAVVDNVPLVAGAQGMYPIATELHSVYATDGYFWEFIAYAAGTGGSLLIIGSAAGVAVMGIEKIDFFWYLRRISLPALIGYLGGAACYMALESWHG